MAINDFKGREKLSGRILKKFSSMGIPIPLAKLKVNFFSTTLPKEVSGWDLHGRDQAHAFGVRRVRFWKKKSLNASVCGIHARLRLHNGSHGQHQKKKSLGATSIALNLRKKTVEKSKGSKCCAGKNSLLQKTISSCFSFNCCKMKQFPSAQNHFESIAVWRRHSVGEMLHNQVELIWISSKMDSSYHLTKSWQLKLVYFLHES